MTIAIPPTFLRFDRAELVGTTLVARGISFSTREWRRNSHTCPLGYVYDKVTEFDAETDLEMAAGHYDEAASVWRFSGDISGVMGLTEPHPPSGREPPPHHTEETP